MPGLFDLFGRGIVREDGSSRCDIVLSRRLVPISAEDRVRRGTNRLLATAISADAKGTENERDRTGRRSKHVVEFIDVFIAEIAE